MKKRGRRRFWSRLIILLVLVAAAVAAYFLFQEKDREQRGALETKVEERKVRKTSMVTSTRKDVM